MVKAANTEGSTRFVSSYSNLVMVVSPAEKGVKGKHIQFENYQYKTADPEEIEFIRSNPGYGVSIIEDKPLR